MKPNNDPPLRRISDCFVKPKSLPTDSNQPYHLPPWDLSMLSFHYIQKALLFHKPHFPIPHLLRRLKTSLAAALFHFYPLSGRLASTPNERQPSTSIYVDIVNSPGARFIHAAMDITASHILISYDIQSLFDLNRAVNFDGHTLPLLSIQVTELLDAVSLACSFNHSIGDGTSFWNFFNMWSEIFESDSDSVVSISRPPILTRWFPHKCGPIINLPFTNPDQFINRFEPSGLKQKVFHFSAQSISNLKEKANAECGTTEISSFQSLSAFVLRMGRNQMTNFMMAANNRRRLKPPISDDYFGNMVTILKAEAEAGELVEAGLGWAARKLHETVTNNTDEKLREALVEWLHCPYTYQLRLVSDSCSLVMASSPRFNMYGNEFGMGKALGVRSGYGNTFDGNVYCNPGCEGGGSMDLEISLLPQTMAILESDTEFMEVGSLMRSQK